MVPRPLTWIKVQSCSASQCHHAQYHTFKFLPLCLFVFHGPFLNALLSLDARRTLWHCAELVDLSYLGQIRHSLELCVDEIDRLSLNRPLELLLDGLWITASDLYDKQVPGLVRYSEFAKRLGNLGRVRV